MKIRSGFVSNSSSSSFIASLGDFNSTLDVALAMIPLRDWGEIDQELMEKAKELIDVLPEETPITFSSCNYDTRIYIEEISPGKRGYIIDTCNNHTFYEIDGFMNVSQEFEDRMDEEELTQRQEYLDIENDIYCSEIPYGNKKVINTLCAEHSEFSVKLTRGEDAGRTVCPKCYSKEIKEKEKEEVKDRVLKDIIDFNDAKEFRFLISLLKNAVSTARKIDKAENDEQKRKIAITVTNAVKDIAVGLTGHEIEFIEDDEDEQ